MNPCGRYLILVTVDNRHIWLILGDWCQSFSRYLFGGIISICKADSYQIYFNTVVALVLTDALDPSPLTLEEQNFFGPSFRGATRAVVRTIGLIIVYEFKRKKLQIVFTYLRWLLARLAQRQIGKMKNLSLCLGTQGQGAVNTEYVQCFLCEILCAPQVVHIAGTQTAK